MILKIRWLYLIDRYHANESIEINTNSAISLQKRDKVEDKAQSERAAR